MRKTFYNLVYQLVFQTTKLILPFITIPIVSQALGPEGLGIYNYTNSIAQYFVLFAGLGIGVYGNRQIAINRDNQTKLSQTFWELFSLSSFFTVISLCGYFILISFFDGRVFFYYQSLIIIGAFFDISWFFMGVEDFKKISLSSLVTQLISFILIVKYVNDGNDLGVYILIQSANILFSQLIMWSYLSKYIKITKISLKKTIRHFMPSLYYFMPKVAIVLYTNLNKTLLGVMDTKESVGYYSNTMMLNGILVTLITTLDLVLLPKMSNLYSKGQENKIVSILSKSIYLQLFFTIPMMFGIILVSSEIVPWFFGDSFLLLSKTIPIISPLIVIIPLGMAIGRQYLVPMNKIKTYNLAVFVGAAISILLNLILIPFIGLFGAIVATLAAEFSVAAIRTRAFLKETEFKLDTVLILKMFLSGILMFVITTFLSKYYPEGVIKVAYQVLTGILVYMFTTSILKINPISELIIKKLKE